MRSSADLGELSGLANTRQTAHQLVRETLRRAILNGTLAGGTRLVQADLAAKLRVSTTPVREALRDLAADGLIVLDAHIGAVVRSLNMDELIEVYEIRKALEPLAMRKAAERITPDQLEDVENLQQRMDTEQDHVAWTDLNRQFHALLEQAAQSPKLQALVKNVQDTAAIYVAHSLKVDPSRIAAGNREHRAILAAMRERDGESAAKLLEEHLGATLDLILQAHAAPTVTD